MLWKLLLWKEVSKLAIFSVYEGFKGKSEKAQRFEEEHKNQRCILNYMLIHVCECLRLQERERASLSADNRKAG